MSREIGDLSHERSDANANSPRRSGVTLERHGDRFAVASLRLEQATSFDSQDEAQRAFDAEVAAVEKDPELMSRLGGA